MAPTLVQLCVFFITLAPVPVRSQPLWLDTLWHASAYARRAHIFPGDSVSAFLSVFWPTNGKPDIWSLMAAQPSDLSDQVEVQQSLSEAHEELGALRAALHQYSSNPSEASLLHALHKVQWVRGQLVQSSRNVVLLPPTIILTHIHLGLLREATLHCRSLGMPTAPGFWKKLSNLAVDHHMVYFRSAFAQWQQWRFNQIVFTHDLDAARAHEYVTVTDHFTLDSITVAQPFARAVQQRLQRAALARVTGVFAATYWLRRMFVIGQEAHPAEPLPGLEAIWMGPYSPATLGLRDTGSVQAEVPTSSGQLVAIHSSFTNDHIASLQFQFAHKLDRRAGSNSTFATTDFVTCFAAPPQSWFSGLELAFSPEADHLVGFAALTKPAGRRPFHLSESTANATVDAPYWLCGGHFGDDAGGITSVSLQFCLSGRPPYRTFY